MRSAYNPHPSKSHKQPDIRAFRRLVMLTISIASAALARQFCLLGYNFSHAPLEMMSRAHVHSGKTGEKRG
ncbi:hypothetical protein AMD24_00444 [Candidatus Xiphinematobacter sp. Idaho Grape]|nr:hypothetical protein AMD24_00444 [Candidatus Xiphinematobacter sp. Idaho Grape]